MAPWYRATDHMTFNLANFLTFSEISPVLITLPDGSKIHAKVSGIVQLSPFLTLSNVLYTWIQGQFDICCKIIPLPIIGISVIQYLP